MGNDFLQWDRGIIGTFVAMLWKPAGVARAFLHERDPRYVKPWRYLLFFILADVAITWFILDQLGMSHRLNLDDEEVGSLRTLLNNAAVLTPFVVVPAALAMRLFFFGLNVRFVDALVMLFYTQGQVNCFSLLSLAALTLTRNAMLEGVITITVLRYFLWALASFGQGSWWRRILAAFGTLIAAHKSARRRAKSASGGPIGNSSPQRERVQPAQLYHAHRTGH